MFFKRRLKNGHDAPFRSEGDGRRRLIAVRLGLAGLLWLTGPVGVLGLSACQSAEEEPGVVARVDGRPVRLGRLQRQYEADRPFLADAGSQLAGLREQYGAALAGLVVQELVDAELERLGLAVGPEETAQAEALVRADYPDAAAFERVAAEECLDLAQWRERLRARLAVDKLKNRVLRERVTVASAEVQAAGQERRDQLAVPERIRARAFQAVDRTRLEERLRQAARQWREESGGKRPPSGPDRTTAPDEVSEREVLVRPDRLPEAWRKALRSLAPGQVSPVLGEPGGWQGFLLLERLPAKAADPVQAYAQMERLILERKLEEALAAWIEERLGQVRITANPRLLSDPAAFDRNTDQPDAAKASGTGP